MNEREIILEALMEILEKKQYSHLVMRGVLDKYAYLDRQQRGFIKRCCEGTVEEMIRLDYAIDSVSKVKCKKMKPLIRTLMRMGAYQILCMEQIPDSAACNECVKLAKKRGFSQLSGFVNGVLRALSRAKNEIVYPDEETQPSMSLSIRYSMPEWIVGMWRERFGHEKTKEMLAALLSVRPLTIRMRENLGPALIGETLERMREQGITLKQNEKLAYAYELQNVDNVFDLPGYEEGVFAVQDVASMLVVELADIRPGDTVIDVCSAPGGKALHAADKLREGAPAEHAPDRTQEGGEVIARDLTEQKTALIRENIQRLHAENVTAQVWDAAQPDESLFGRADVVIADLPCSGLGVIARKSDIKYRVTPEDVEALAALQRKILSVCWQYVRPGGTLLFSTCSITDKENAENTAYILENLPFGLVKEVQLLPGIDGCDGFYMAKLVRNG